MKWSFVIYALMSSAVIATSVMDESRHKRTLSFFTRLLSNSNGMASTQVKASKTNAKSLKKSKIRQQDVVKTVPEKTRSKGRRGRKRMKNNEPSFLTNFANGPFQTISHAFGGTTNTRTSTKKSTKERPQRIHNLSGNKLIFNNEQILTTTPRNYYTENIVYNTPSLAETYVMPSMAQSNQIITIPRKYSYELKKGEIVQTHAYDNSDVILTGNNMMLSRPQPSYAYQVYPSISSAQYQQPTLTANIVYGQQQQNDMLMLPHYGISTYTGQPIIVSEGTSEIEKYSIPSQHNEIKKFIDTSYTEKPRGDIPD